MWKQIAAELSTKEQQKQDEAEQESKRRGLNVAFNGSWIGSSSDLADRLVEMVKAIEDFNLKSNLQSASEGYNPSYCEGTEDDFSAKSIGIVLSMLREVIAAKSPKAKARQVADAYFSLGIPRIGTYGVLHFIKNPDHPGKCACGRTIIPSMCFSLSCSDCSCRDAMKMSSSVSEDGVRGGKPIANDKKLSKGRRGVRPSVIITDAQREDMKMYRSDYETARANGSTLGEWIQQRGVTKKDHKRAMNATKPSRLKPSRLKSAAEISG